MKNTLITTFFLLFAYAVFIQFAPEPDRALFQSQWQSNRYVIEKYFRESVTTSKVVFVGTSLTARLDFKQADQCVYNLAQRGGSSLTGLGVIASAEKMPAKVFVEINFPGRGKESIAVDDQGSFLSAVSPVFYIENIPVNRFYSLLFSSRDVVESAVNISAFKTSLAVHQNRFAQDIDDEKLAESVQGFREMISKLESKGVQVILFEMPVHVSLEHSIQVRKVRNAFVNAFPQNRFMTFEELSKGVNVMTTDGLHLHENEVKGVVNNLSVHLADVCRD